MDQHRPRTTDKSANANGGGIVGANPPADRNEPKTPEPPHTVEKEILHATNVAGELIDHAKSAAGEAIAAMSENLGEQVQDIGARARDQAAATTDAVRQQGRRAGDYLSRNAQSKPLTTLLVAGAVGYALGYLVHRR